MIDMKEKIARSLDQQFAQMGFATHGVEALRAGADVSLRTLYKYFPSREAMVVGALEHRDRIYLEWIGKGPSEGAAHVLHPLQRLSDWLHEISNLGCIFRNALAAYPDSVAIRESVERHKSSLRDMFRARLTHVAPDCDAEMLAEALFLLHEGLTETARLRGAETASRAAMLSACALLTAHGIQSISDLPPERTQI